ncbi:MAG: hypothetical protein ACREOW_10755 [Thermodesulfobacteriota bacterium]
MEEGESKIVSNNKETTKDDFRKRSSNYPYLNLQEALEYAKKLYNKDARNYVPLKLLHQRWGYNELSSTLKLTVAALKYYGLIDDQGKADNRTIRISEQGFRIIKGAPNSEKLIKDVALQPKLFKELWDKYKDTGLPQNDIIINYLIWERQDFTEKAAKHAVERFKETIEFAKLESDDIIEEPQDKEDENMLGEDVIKPPKEDKIPPETKDFMIINSIIGSLKIRYPMTKEKLLVIDQFIKAESAEANIDLKDEETKKSE